jgi:hypothetical protein
LPVMHRSAGTWLQALCFWIWRRMRLLHDSQGWCATRGRSCLSGCHADSSTAGTHTTLLQCMA